MKNTKHISTAAKILLEMTYLDGDTNNTYHAAEIFTALPTDVAISIIKQMDNDDKRRHKIAEIFVYIVQHDSFKILVALPKELAARLITDMSQACIERAVNIFEDICREDIKEAAEITAKMIVLGEQESTAKIFAMMNQYEAARIFTEMSKYNREEATQIIEALEEWDAKQIALCASSIK